MSKLMRIGIDARFYGPTAKGLGRYVQKLIENLEKIDGNSQRIYYIFLRKETYAEFIPQYSNFIKVLADYRWYGFQEQFFFPFLLYRYRLDLVHFCHFNVPIFYRKKFIVTIHDLILLHYSTLRSTTLNWYFYFFKLFAYRLTISSAIRRSERTIVVSRYTQDDVIKYFGIDPQKLVMIYEGCERFCFFQPKERSTTFLKRYGIIKPYLLYVGNAYPHKNLERLALAFKKIRGKYPELHLVLVGGSDFFYERLKNFLEQEQISNVVIVGQLSDVDLDLVYKEAQLYVFPSLYEGFGLPPLEALAKGLAVVSSNRTSMPEILGKAAIYFDPENSDSIANAVLRGLESLTIRKRLIKEGIKRIKLFDWQKMAEKTLEVYKKTSC